MYPRNRLSSTPEAPGAHGNEEQQCFETRATAPVTRQIKFCRSRYSTNTRSDSICSARSRAAQRIAHDGLPRQNSCGTIRSVKTNALRETSMRGRFGALVRIQSALMGAYPPYPVAGRAA